VAGSMQMSGRSAARGVAVGVVAVLGLSLAACSSSGGGSGGAVDVVASTNVWGDIATQVAGSLAGSRVQVTSIIADPSVDPHSFEPDARTALSVKRSDLLIQNGGGYDDFMGTLRSSTGTKATVLDAVSISGHKAPAGGDLNEHVWYDFPTVIKVADDIATALAGKDPKDAKTYRANVAAFDGKVRALEHTETVIEAAHHGEGAAITEPVPLYMLQACGLVNKTPAAFSEAVENGTDVPVRVLAQTEALFADHAVSLLAYNEQTTGAETQAVLSAAKQHDVPVVPVTETLPTGKSYLSWMTGNLAAIQSALH
jgi:zinc/manganese transport system substrate-binding protein